MNPKCPNCGKPIQSLRLMMQVYAKAFRCRFCGVTLGLDSRGFYIILTGLVVFSLASAVCVTSAVLKDVIILPVLVAALLIPLSCLIATRFGRLLIVNRESTDKIPRVL